MVSDSRIQGLRKRLSHGEDVSQQRLDKIASEFGPAKRRLRPHDKDEDLPLFSSAGRSLGTTAPRWLCHLLALRHRCVHVVFVWRSPALGNALVLQIRGWTKDDSPGHIDISVGGHMTSDQTASSETAAFSEMLQETGLSASDLAGELEHVGGYSFNESRRAEGFYNSERRDVYVCRLKRGVLGKIHFPDGEVAGVVVIRLRDARALLKQKIIPLASALTKSLPICLKHIERAG